MSITFRMGAQPLEIVRNDGLLRILTGGPGLRGLPGPGGAGTIEIGTVTTLDPGDSVTVENSGSPTAAVLNFALPKGDKGDKGDQGDQGNPGLGSGGYGLPLGGTIGQILYKSTNANGASAWGGVPDVALPARLRALSAQPTYTDANALNETGWYFLVQTSANIPVAAHGYICQFTQTNTANQAHVQVWYEANGNRQFTRYQWYGSWQAWVPCGPIVQGSNANGTYTRFADGTQICRVTKSALGPVNTTYGGAGALYRSATLTGVWPANFVDTPQVSLSCGSPGVTQGIVFPTLNQSPSSWGSVFLVCAASSADTNWQLNVVGFGRWF